MKLEKVIWSLGAVAMFGAMSSQADAQSLWRPDSRYASLVGDRTAKNVGDIITIVVSEQQSIQDKNNTKIERTSSMAATPKSFQLTTHTPISLPSIEIDSSRKLDAKADAQKSGSFSTTIAGTVVDVQPNGNLVVSGRRRIFIDDDEKTLEIVGVVRPYDVSTTNTVFSYQMAEARIAFVGEGPVAEASKKGWLSQAWDSFWNLVWPF